jgi:hypothetical protein
MIELLQTIVNTMVCWIETAVVTVFNILIFAIGGLLAAFAAVMPSIPDAPSLPGPMTTALGWISWVFPVSTLVDIVAFFTVVWVLWFALSIAMRWAKAVA